MIWSITWAPAAARDLSKLDRGVKERVVAAVVRYAETGHGDVKRLKGLDEYRLRVGAWRVRFARDATAGQMLVLRVLPRGSAYR